MNKYQKRIHKETIEYLCHNNSEYKKLRKIIKWLAKHQIFGSPCENCDNCYCTRKKNKLAYCKDKL